MAQTATVTAKIGIAQAVTSAALTGVSAINVNTVNQTCQVFCDQGEPTFDIKNNQTFTLTASGFTYTLTIS